MTPRTKEPPPHGLGLFSAHRIAGDQVEDGRRDEALEEAPQCGGRGRDAAELALYFNKRQLKGRW